MKPRKTSSDKRVSDSRKKKEKTKHGRVKFDSRVRIEAKGAQITTDAGLLIMRDLADAIGLTDMAQATLRDTRPGKNKVHSLEPKFSSWSLIPASIGWCFHAKSIR